MFISNKSTPYYVYSYTILTFNFDKLMLVSGVVMDCMLVVSKGYYRGLVESPKGNKIVTAYG